MFDVAPLEGQGRGSGQSPRPLNITWVSSTATAIAVRDEQLKELDLQRPFENWAGMRADEIKRWAGMKS